MRAVELVMGEQWGQMATIRANHMTSCSLEEATSGVKELDPELYRTAKCCLVKRSLSTLLAQDASVFQA
jgi:hypothetical protein